MDAFPSNVKFVLLWLLCTIMFTSVMCSLNIHCNENDMKTLLHLKQGVVDPSGLLSSWLTQQNCCEWEGVKCDNTRGRVTELNLPCHAHDDKSHCLTGQLNLSLLLQLEFLSYLNFNNNAFNRIQLGPKCLNMSTHTHSHQCTNSSKLHFLDLSYNHDIFIDNLHWISRLSSLQYLNLGGIGLPKETGWLQSVTMLPSLLELHLPSCQLQNIYPSIHYANFTSLQVLDLAHNNFLSDEFPNWLFNLTSDISHIDLSQNKIHGQLPNMLSNIRRSIESLNLSYNALNGHIPNWIGELGQLEELDLSSNSFSGPIPTGLGNLSSLIVLNLYSNHLNGNLPESLGQLFNLESLLLGDNSLTGVVSARNLLSLSKLRYLFIGSPSLIFDFDPEWLPPFQLQNMWLSYVSGKLPLWLFTQSSLKGLLIADSTASFEPLDKFWNLATQLEILSLINNSINGDMSNVLLNSKVAWLSFNNLRGGLPRLSPNVVVLNLWDNSLSGSISPLLCHNTTEKSNLKYLHLENNLLSADLTDCWNNWEKLMYVGLGRNKLTGKIPRSLASLSNLISLDLNHNNLFGDIPLSLKNCKNLLVLDLSHNNFSGAVPSWMGKSLKALQLRSNQFSGNIPPQVCQLNSLMVMDFGNNRLSGPIPNCLHNITTMLSDSNYASTYEIFIPLEVEGETGLFEILVLLFAKGSESRYLTIMYAIDLSSNSFSGTVPLEIFMLTRLQSMNLSHNQLVGTIPEEIGNLKQLESIDLSSNHLWGEIPQSISGLSFLGTLNLSFNNFTGKIPTGTQLEGFTNLSYTGNSQLCGPPLTKICPEDKKSFNTKPIVEDEDDTAAVHSWFYMGMRVGFAVGFLGVLIAIFFISKCRHAYFRFLQRLNDVVI